MTSLSVCAAADWKDHRIPNRALAIAGGVVFCSMVWEAWEKSGWRGALFAGGLFLARLICTGMLGFPFFLLRMTGAGDVKMTAVIAAALGMERGAAAVGIGASLGAVLALGKMLRYGGIFGRYMYLFAYIRRVFRSKRLEAYYLPERDGEECVIPFGACLWMGVLTVVLQMR